MPRMKRIDLKKDVHTYSTYNYKALLPRKLSSTRIISGIFRFYATGIPFRDSFRGKRSNFFSFRCRIATSFSVAIKRKSSVASYRRVSCAESLKLANVTDETRRKVGRPSKKTKLFRGTLAPALSFAVQPSDYVRNPRRARETSPPGEILRAAGPTTRKLLLP